jgi:hypothetical protein
MRAQGRLDGSMPILSIATPDSTSVCTGANEDASISNNLVDCALEISGKKAIMNARTYFIRISILSKDHFYSLTQRTALAQAQLL